MKTSFSLVFRTCLFLYGCQMAFHANAQQRIRVPADFQTIQSAVNAAQEGDTVLVSPGTYYENVQLRGRNIVLTSRYFLDNDPASIIRTTIIDGSQPAHPDTASCILVWKGESQNTVIQGFTLQNGSGTVWWDHYVPAPFREGGGILTDLSSPVIRHNIIRNNIVPKVGANLMSHGGGGIRCGDGSPRIEGNQIVHNRADGYGGGIVLNYCPNAVIANNLIAHNIGGDDFSGGGVWLNGQDNTTINTLTNNTIAYNHSDHVANPAGGKAGGIWIYSIKAKLENNIIWGNTQTTGKPIASEGALYELKNNCIETGFIGMATIAANPMFRDTVSFVLEAGSPAVDAGRPESAYDDASLNGQRALFPSRGKTRADLGVYGGKNHQNPALNASFFNNNIFSKVVNSPVVTRPGDSRSVNWVDVDNDTDLDLFITNGPESGENNFLYKNNGNGGFSAVAQDPIVQDNKPSDGATWADVDNDGDNDCFVVNWYGANNLFYRNLGNGTFEQVTTDDFVNDGGYSETASWGDYDRDGWLDLYVTNSDGDKRNFLYKNAGNGTFSKVTTGSPVTDALKSRCVNWVDFDLDGDDDLFVTNEADQPESFYRNNDGVFQKITGIPLVMAAGKTMSASWGDMDNDGDEDVYLANDQGNDKLFRNDQGAFTAITTGPVVNSGGNSFGSAWGDVDLDGDLDLFVTNAFWGGAWKNFLFINDGPDADGNPVFSQNATELPATDQGWSFGCAFGDMDRDGDLDLAVANCLNASQTEYLYENHASEMARHWVGIRCIGVESNRGAIGAKVFVTATINGQQRTQMRQISAQTGYCGQNQMEAHFGLANAAILEMVRVVWPSGHVDTLNNLPADQYWNLVEGLGISAVSGQASSLVQELKAIPNPFSDTVACAFNLTKSCSIAMEMYDSSGRNVANTIAQALQPGNQNIQLKGLDIPAGHYYIVLKNGPTVVGSLVVINE